MSLWVLLLIVIASVLIRPVPAGALEPEILRDGAVYSITPADTECVTDTGSNPSDANGYLMQAVCDVANGTAYVHVITFTTEGNAHAFARFRYFFIVDEVPGVSKQSFVPIHVRIPVDWVFRLFHTTQVRIEKDTAEASVKLSLWENPPLHDPLGRGTDVLAIDHIMSAAHQGNGCLSSLPAGAAALAFLALECALNNFQELNGRSVAELSAVVEVGRTYNIELEIRAGGVKNSFGFTGVRAESANTFGDDHPGLRWDRMMIAVGSDPQQLVAGFQEQIGALHEEIDELRVLLTTHKHNYLTGRGQGHNNTQAVSSPPVFPGTSVVDVTKAQALTPATGFSK